MLKPIYLAPLLALALLSTALAQESAIATRTSSLTITAAATGDAVRITAPSSVVQMHVEVYGASGEKLFDQEIRGGNVFDWHLQDGQAQRLAPGAYVCVVTAKSVSGRISQKLGTVTVAEKSASVQAGSPQLSPQQTQVIGPVETDSSWTIAGENEPQTPTVIANDGTDGQMIRGRGALTFRIGNFFSGIDTEQMRLTEAGDLGIGTSSPRAKLDVAGTVRAERFLVAKPSKTSNQAQSDDSAQATSDSVQPLVAGTGTQNRLAKWTDNAGTLGDSVITETAGGNIGIGTVSPGVALDVFTSGASTDLKVREASRTVDLSSNWSSGISAVGTLTNNKFGLAANGGIRLLLDPSGKVGIGTTSPGVALDVVTAGAATDIQVREASRTVDISSNWTGGISGIGTTTNNKFGLASNGTMGLTLDTSGNVGIGTTSPQQDLSVNGAMNVDQANLNGGSFSPGISFGSFSGESIASNRTQPGSHNQFGLDFYTNSLNRMSITNGGNVGIGTTNPGAPLDVQVAAGQSLQFRQDSGLVPGINVKTTGGLAGIMRLRNSVEVWPSDDATRAGKVDVRDTSGFPTISLDGQTGNLSATGDASFRNLPGIQFSQGPNANTLISAGQSVAVDSLTINAPASGFIFVAADVEASTEHGGNHVFDFTLSSFGTNIVNSKSQTRTNTSNLLVINGEVPIHLSWVFPVNAGSLQLSTSLYYDNFCDCGASATVKSHNLTAIYLPKQY